MNACLKMKSLVKIMLLTFMQPAYSQSCTASTDPSKDGSDGSFYCINGGTVGGTTPSCTCTSCDAGYDGTSCQTPSTCTASSDSSKDGSDGTFYCINGGTIGGTTGSCTCTSCNAGYGGASCQTANPCDASGAPTNGGVGDCTSSIASGGTCQPTCNTGYTVSGTSSCVAGTLTAATCSALCMASDFSNKDGSDGTFYCINGGTVGGTTGSCSCTSCNAGYGGASCQTPSTCTASSDSSKDGSDGTFYCINGGTIGGTTGSCTCTSCNAGYGGASCQTANPCDASGAPTNGGVGDCTSSIASGGTCQPTCNTGYTVSGTSSCVAGTLTAATCSALCMASDFSNKDGSDGTFYCINGGTVGGTTGSCSCTSCNAGYGGASCQTASCSLSDGLQCSPTQLIEIKRLYNKHPDRKCGN